MRKKADSKDKHKLKHQTKRISNLTPGFTTRVDKITGGGKSDQGKKLNCIRSGSTYFSNDLNACTFLFITFYMQLCSY